MRGITEAERAQLALFPVVPTGELVEIDDESTIPALEALVGQGRMSVMVARTAEGSERVYHPTPLGRLALKLWPATRHTEGAPAQ